MRSPLLLLHPGLLGISLCLALAPDASATLLRASPHQLGEAEAIFEAVEKAIHFMLRNNKEINLDGVTGVRILQGIYSQLIHVYGKKLPEGMVSRLESLCDLAEIVSQVGTYAVATSTPYYFSKDSFLLDPGLWQFLLPSRHLREVPSVHMDTILDGDSLVEDTSDSCLREFIPHGKHKRCSISRGCFKGMNTGNFTSYSLTHQVMYYLVGIGARCELQLADLAEALTEGGSVEAQLAGFCAKIDSEARTLAENGFPMEMRDLFMEQIGVCGIAGFTGIARVQWLGPILQWQDPASGCYHRFEGEYLDPENFNPLRYGNFRKRSESAMPGEGSEAELCLSHRTAVALMALAAFTRRIAEQVAAL